jgi:hypothetical protein
MEEPPQFQNKTKVSTWQIVAFLIIIVAIAAGIYFRNPEDSQIMPGDEQMNESRNQNLPGENETEQIEKEQSTNQTTTPSIPSALPSQTGSFGLTITAPSQGQQFFRGAKQIITWDGIFADRVEIYLKRSGSSFSRFIAEGTYGTVGKYEWAVPTNLTPANNYYLMIIPQIESYRVPATSATFTITDAPNISAVNSNVEALPFSLSAEANCFAAVTVQVLNEYNLPLSDKKVSLDSEREQDFIVAINNTTTQNGIASFKVGSLQQGTSIFTAIVNGVKINDTAAVAFHRPPPFCETR